MAKLAPCPSLLQDPAEHDFRAPDLAWVYDDGMREDLEEANFGNYAAQIWIGPQDAAKRFADALANAYAKWGKALRKGDPDMDEGEEASAVLYWENPKLAVAAVAVVPFSDRTAFPHKENPSPIPAGGEFDAMVALPGSEAISPFEMLDDLASSPDEAAHLGLSTAIELIRSITTPTYAAEVDDLIAELFPVQEQPRKSPSP